MGKRKTCRADERLVECGLAENLTKAQALIMSGVIVAGERRVEKPGEKIPADCEIRFKNGKLRPYVSRGGLKLEGALDHFDVKPAGLICLDLGASTGGFTDCLLRRGATKVYAVDVGENLLDWRLRGDARVVNLEGVHAKDLTAEQVPEKIQLLVADISFNSLSRVLPPCLPFLAPGANLVLLVKPQFELDRDEIGEGGIIREEALREKACARVEQDVRDMGLMPRGLTPSQICGTHGNQEFLLWAQALEMPESSQEN